MLWSPGPCDLPTNRCRRVPLLTFGILIGRLKVPVRSKLQFACYCASAPEGHTNMVPEAIEVMNETLDFGQREREGA